MTEKTYEVETNLIVHCKVLVFVTAEDRRGAIERCAELMPNNFDAGSQHGWRANVMLRPPEGTLARFVKATHFEQASGSDRARVVVR